MKRLSLAAAATLILLANCIALIHVAWNRSGQPETEITLTERELSYHHDPDDSGVDLFLQWQDLSGLNERKLRELGFDCTLAASDPFSRQDPKRAFVALEYEGGAWRSWLESKASASRGFPVRTHLAAVDTALSQTALRAKYPDRSRVLILPAMIQILLTGEGVTGYIQQVPARIHVPRPFADGFRAMRNDQHSYRVKLRYGQLLEPWVTSVDFSPHSR